MISLRTKEGIDLNKLEREFGLDEKIRIQKQAQKFINHKLAAVENCTIRLTNDGMLMADGIASELFKS
jgi:oxygen-independent coproporphyrinogen-3 oxidase